MLEVYLFIVCIHIGMKFFGEFFFDMKTVLVDASSAILLFKCGLLG